MLKKVLLIGDTHFKIQQFQLMLGCLNDIRTIVLTHKEIDSILFLGDIFDTHAVLRSELLTTFQLFLKEISQVVPVYILVGNHDQYRPKDNKFTSLDLYNLKNVAVIHQPTKIKDLVLFPYLNNPKDVLEYEGSIFFMHQSFTGADYGHIKVEDGLEPSDLKADYIVSGHIHKKQNLGTKVFYPGTPFATNATDAGQTKGFHILDTETLKYDFIRSTLPMYISLTIDVAVNGETALDAFLNGVNNKQDFYVITIKGPEREIVAFTSSDKFSAVQDEYPNLRLNFEKTNVQKKRTVFFRLLKSIWIKCIQAV